MQHQELRALNNRVRFGGIAVLLACALLSGCPRRRPPEAAFSADITAGEAPLTVQFSDQSRPGSEPVSQWRWRFGDGAESAEQNPSHVYAAEGRYTVSLEVASAAGSDTETKIDFISVTEPEAEPGQVDTVTLPGGVTLDMVRVPAGTFLMGAAPGERGAQPDEQPRHEVTLTKGFWIGRSEVTKAQWLAVMDAPPPWEGRPNSSDDPDSPAVWLSWEDCAAFNARLGELTGKTYRLPTEAEWELACRAGTADRFYWGDDPDALLIGEHAWWNGNAFAAGEPYAHPVGLKVPNALGLHGMSGNAWEWCQNWYYAYGDAPVTDPAGPATGLSRIMRGGAWFSGADRCRSAHRTHNIPQYVNAATGFRPAR